MSLAKTEQKKTPWILGVLNLIACAIMFAAFYFMYGIASDYDTVWPFFAYTLPFLVIAILNLVGGVFILKGKNQIYGAIGVILIPVGVVYFLVLAAA